MLPTSGSLISASQEATMTWEQAVTLFIIPAAVALVLGLGAIWLSRYTP